jgi:hypothetical protein
MKAKTLILSFKPL